MRRKKKLKKYKYEIEKNLIKQGKEYKYEIDKSKFVSMQSK